MSSNYTRSYRLDEDLIAPMTTLPPKSANALMNHLLHIYFSDEDLRKKVADIDMRFTGFNGPIVKFYDTPPHPRPEKVSSPKPASETHESKSAPVTPPKPAKSENLPPSPPVNPQPVEKAVEKSYDLIDSILPG